MASQGKRFKASISLLSDLVATAVSFGAAIWLRRAAGGWTFVPATYGLLLVFIIALWTGVFFLTVFLEGYREERGYPADAPVRG